MCMHGMVILLCVVANKKLVAEVKSVPKMLEMACLGICLESSQHYLDRTDINFDVAVSTVF